MATESARRALPESDHPFLRRFQSLESRPCCRTPNSRKSPEKGGPPVQDHNDRKLPPPLDERLVPNDFRNGKMRQETAPRPPLRAVRIKADQLRNAIHRRNGRQLDLSDIYERFIDLWSEARLVIWRAKHAKAGIKQIDPKTGKEVLTFISDDRLVLQAIETTKGVLDSLVKLRREMGSDSSQIPHWAIDRIEKALRNHPEALADLLKALAEGEDIIQ